MNAIRVDGPALRWTSAPEPVPGAGEVAIRVRATAVNRADLLQRSGAYPPPPGASPILGLECSGTIAALGEGVTGFAVGDRVCALLSGGGYAEVVTCPAGQVLPVPDGLAMIEAAALPEAVCTTWMVLRDEGRLAPGERVLIHAGASGIGTTMIQVCRAWGNPCFVTVGTAEKVARCVSLGAEGGAARTDGPWEDAVRRWAKGGVDLIVDPVGGATTEAGQKVLATDGRIVLIGLMGGAEARVSLAALLMRRQRLVGTTLRSRVPAEKARIVAGVARDVWPWVASGRVRPIIDRTLPITEAAAAHEAIASNATVGKVVLVVDTA